MLLTGSSSCGQIGAPELTFCLQRCHNVVINGLLVEEEGEEAAEEQISRLRLSDSVEEKFPGRK